MESFNDIKKNDLLGDLQEETSPEPVRKGIRFANFLVDYIVLIILFVLLFRNAAFSQLESQLVFIAMYVPYYSLMEGFLNGRTIGKMVTGTRVARYDNEPMSFGKALVRTFSRLVPFEPLSGFGDAPWHDKWTDTTVVKD